MLVDDPPDAVGQPNGVEVEEKAYVTEAEVREHLGHVDRQEPLNRLQQPRPQRPMNLDRRAMRESGQNHRPSISLRVLRVLRGSTP